MTLTEFLLFLMLSTFVTYTFIPWKNMEKPSFIKIFIFWISSIVVFALIVFLFANLGFIT